MEEYKGYVINLVIEKYYSRWKYSYSEKRNDPVDSKTNIRL